ncbi:MAG: alpha/beta hydrolase [Shinella sp. 65-6]|mgnify:CR=1 FL=1|nr:alpha/beta hydrolase [Hyphomicrobiales bacterium]OJU88399.1 MAG: alpha/beta hydrolase [Shinella sp. 65-6]
MTNFTSRFFPAPDGLRLHARDYAPGAAARLPIVCLPGLSRNARDFHPFALLLSQDAVSPRRVIALDYRGRGLSARDENPANYNVATECRDVIAVCAALGISRAVFVGTSRGGLILHMMAAVQPELIAATVLNDIGPEIEAEGLKEIRDYLSNRAFPATIEAAADALERVHGPSFPALGRTDWLDMADAIYTKTGDGHLIPDHDPALTDQLQAIDFSKPLPTLWPQFDLLPQKPLLVVRGDHSRLFSARTLGRMKMRAPGIETATAEGQGHAPLLHHASVFPQVKAFLDRQ